MIKQHAIADFSTSQLIFSCMFVSETLLQRKKRTVRFTKVELWLIQRAYRAHPTRWMDVLNDVKANMGVLPEQTRQLYISSAKRLGLINTEHANFETTLSFHH